ncbi:hypothetical protein J4H86_05650 [Spiractinospora alimapuensis]|uniref:hypothetical protein n=1 Tax=Spiractinospora alimapuensis TaxID=2820884 RepID=UPI001F47B39F|nr:hypothetical protein [Spiractinospora alimapuensis]QVQ53261.1 hypothetical protein J4H86_05650 [Spiractinospora alimapuensis]
MAVSDEAVRERTGRGWEEWFEVLDAWGARDHGHTEIARWLVEEGAVDGWWAQTITVGYEQSRGMRSPGQQPDGTFSVSAAKTLPASAERVFAAFVEEERRRRWLVDDRLHLRRTTQPRSLRADWGAGGDRVTVTFTVKGPDRCQVAVEHGRLADAEAAARTKEYWRAALDALREELTDATT